MIDIREHGGGYGGGISKKDILKYSHRVSGRTVLDTTEHAYNFIHALGNGLAIQHAWTATDTYTRKLVLLGKNGNSSYIKTINSSPANNGSMVDVDYTNNTVVFYYNGRLICINSNLDIAWDIPHPVTPSGSVGVCIRKGVILVYNKDGNSAFVQGSTGEIISTFTIPGFSHSSSNPCIDFNDNYILVLTGPIDFRIYNRTSLATIVSGSTGSTSVYIAGLALTKGRIVSFVRNINDNLSYIQHYSWDGTTLGTQESTPLANTNQNTIGANKNLLRVVKGVLYAHSSDLFAISARGNSLAKFPRSEFSSMAGVVNNVTTDGEYITCNDQAYRMCTAKIEMDKTII